MVLLLLTASEPDVILARNETELVELKAGDPNALVAADSVGFCFAERVAVTWGSSVL